MRWKSTRWSSIMAKTTMYSMYPRLPSRNALGPSFVFWRGLRGHNNCSYNREEFGTKRPKKYRSKWEGIFHLVVLDEGHKLRHWWMRTYAVVKGLRASVHWFLTATPIVNSSLVSSFVSYPYEQSTDNLSRTYRACLFYCDQEERKVWIMMQKPLRGWPSLYY